MASKRVPCSDCSAEREELEEMGKIVLSCEPVEGRPGWCEITWRDARSVRSMAPPVRSKRVSAKKTVRKAGRGDPHDRLRNRGNADLGRNCKESESLVPRNRSRFRLNTVILRTGQLEFNRRIFSIIP